MNKVYLVFEGDDHLSDGSLVLMGVFDGLNAAVSNIICEMSDALMFDETRTAEKTTQMLFELRQTQGYDTNYHIEEVELNKWEEII